MRKSFFLALALAATTAQAEIEITDGFVRATPPGAVTSAAFMKIHNSGTEAVELVKADTNVSKVTELHNVKAEQGVMKMFQVPSMQIPAGATLELKPGSYHIMLIGLHNDITEGDKVSLAVEFSDGSTQQLSLPAMRPTPMGAMSGHQHGEGGMHSHDGPMQAQ